MFHADSRAEVERWLNEKKITGYAAELVLRASAYERKGAQAMNILKAAASIVSEVTGASASYADENKDASTLLILVAEYIGTSAALRGGLTIRLPAIRQLEQPLIRPTSASWRNRVADAMHFIADRQAIILPGWRIHLPAAVVGDATVAARWLKDNVRWVYQTLVGNILLDSLAVPPLCPWPDHICVLEGEEPAAFWAEKYNESLAE